MFDLKVAFEYSGYNCYLIWKSRVKSIQKFNDLLKSDLSLCNIFHYIRNISTAYT